MIDYLLNKLFYLTLPFMATIGLYPTIIVFGCVHALIAWWGINKFQHKIIKASFAMTLIAYFCMLAYIAYDIKTSTSSTATIDLVYIPGAEIIFGCRAFLLSWSIITFINDVYASITRTTSKIPAYSFMIATLVVSITVYAGYEQYTKFSLYRLASSETSSPMQFAHAYITAEKNNDNTLYQALAGNAALPKELYLPLYTKALTLKDGDRFKVLKQFSSNPKTPTTILVAMTTINEPYIVALAAANPNIPSKLLANLVNSKDAIVREYATSNPAIKMEWLKKLAKDPDSTVRELAKYKIQDYGSENTKKV